jgi:hypothetical protein
VAAPLLGFPQISGSLFEMAGLYDSGGQLTQSVVVGDVNGDGNPDLLVASQCSGWPTNCPGTVSVLLGNGDGTFQPAVDYGSGGNQAYSVVVGDVNGDGKLDLVVANSCASSDSFCENGALGTVGVLLGIGDGSFQEAVSYSSGGDDSTSVVLRDVNGDGKPDLLVANDCADSNCQSGAVGVLLGNGDGTFQAPVIYGSGGQNADAIAVGDVNGDGNPDLLVADQCGNAEDPDTCLGTVGVLLGNGDGTFQDAVTYSAGGFGATSVAVGDVNGDGKLDLMVVVLCPGSGSCASSLVGVLLGNGDGTFRPAVTYGSGGQDGGSVVIGDVNGDGKPDLLVANLCAIGDGSCANGGAAGVLLGKGDGTFRMATAYASGGLNANAVAVADVNGDGNLDLLMSNYCVSSENCNGAVGVLAGNGDGTFQAVLIYGPGGQNADAVAVGDVNGDGNPDLLIATQCASYSNCETGGVGVLLGRGDGSFQTVVSYGTGGYDARSVALRDVNGDGKLDLVVANTCIANGTCTGSVGVLLGNGDGTFQAAVPYASGGFYATSVAIADVNGDGKPDLLVTNECATSECTSAVVGVLLGNGDGSFQAAVPYASGGYYATSLGVSDLNGDGKLDLVVANECAVGSNCSSSGNVSVLLGNGDGSFRAAVTYGSGGQFPYSVAVGDVSGDGKADLLVVNQCADSVCANGSLGVLLGNGNGVFPTASPTTIPAFSFAALALADFDGDGRLDVASSGGILLLGKGDGSFQDALSLGVAGFGIAVGDFNRDGRADLALGGIAVLLNTGTQGLKTTASLVSSLNPSNFGQAVTLTARLTPHGTYSPTGSIVFRDGATVLGTMSLSNRHTNFITSTLSGGSHSITASYSGDSNFLATVSSALNQQIAVVSTVTTLTSSTSPIPLNQAVTYTAAVASQYGGTVTGTVTFKDRAATIAVVSMTGNQASCSISYSVAGTHLITAVYSGDVSNSGSTSPILKAYVESGPVASKTVITTSGSPSLIDQPVNFTAMISSAYGSIPDGGTVNFYDGTAAIGSGETTGSVATLSTSGLSTKTHIIKATYMGDASFKSSSGSVQQVVLTYQSSVTVTLTPSPSAYGQAVTVTATVTSTAPGGPTGAVTFKNGSTVLGTATLNSGTASLITTKLAVGTDSITASYNGDTRSAKSVEAMTDIVHQATTVAALASSLNPSPAGRIVRLTATVDSPTTLVTGSVTFMDGANTLATVNLTGGKATYSTTTLSVGAHNVTAVYHGTVNIIGCTSPSLMQTVN